MFQSNEERVLLQLLERANVEVLTLGFVCVPVFLSIQVDGLKVEGGVSSGKRSHYYSSKCVQTHTVIVTCIAGESTPPPPPPPPNLQVYAMGVQVESLNVEGGVSSAKRYT